MKKSDASPFLKVLHRALHLILAASVVFAWFHSKADAQEAPFRGSIEWTARDGSLTMGLRSNSPHFWAWAAQHAGEYLPAEVLQFMGFGAGDSHHEQFSFAQTEAGRVLVLNDHDEMGWMSLYLDFVKFLAVSRSIADVHYNYKDALTAYIEGLEGKKSEVPRLLVEDASISEEELQKRYLAKIARMTKDEKEFRRDDGLAPERDFSNEQKERFAKYEQEVFLSLFPQGYSAEDIQDRAIYVKAKGDPERYWYYLRKSPKKQEILEFKVLGTPIVTNLYPQNNLSREEIAKQGAKIFWQGHTPLNSAIFAYDKRIFSMRPRLPVLMELNADDYRDKLDEIAELSYYLTRELGRFHSASASPGYAEYLKKNFAQIQKGTKEMGKDYLKEAREVHRLACAKAAAGGSN